MKIILPLFLASLFFAGCIKDDFVDDEVSPELRISTMLDTIAEDSNFVMEAMYLNNVGQEEEAQNLIWTSSDTSIMSINKLTGLLYGKQFGSSVISVSYTNDLGVFKDSLSVEVGLNTVLQESQLKSGTINTTSTYELFGDFDIEQTETGVVLKLAENYTASTALPGLYVYLSNNNSTIVGALEIGAVEVFSGAHEYVIPDVSVNDYTYVLYFCKPFNVKVGDGKIQ